jgi:hypothetical protein
MNKMNTADILADHIWERPPSYGGHSPDGHYVVAAITRDATISDESNWAQWRAELSPADDDFDAPVYTFLASHWVCGWVEYLIVRRDAPAATIDTAGEILAALSDYPIIDEMDYSDRQFTAICDYWEQAGLRDRIQWCSENGESIFAARRVEIPGGVMDDFLNSEMFI